MITKTVKYTDYNGVNREETLYFNLNKAEILEIAMKSTKSDIPLDHAVDIVDVANLTMFFKDILLSAYGVKSPDGRRFIKSQELRDEFSQTEAFSVLFTDLALNSDEMQGFINALIPPGVVADIQSRGGASVPAVHEV